MAEQRKKRELMQRMLSIVLAAAMTVSMTAPVLAADPSLEVVAETATDNTEEKNEEEVVIEEEAPAGVTPTKKARSAGASTRATNPTVVIDVAGEPTEASEWDKEITLTATAKYDDGANDATATHQWESFEAGEWKEIPSATTLNYTPDKEKAGKKIRLAVAVEADTSGNAWEAATGYSDTITVAKKTLDKADITVNGTYTFNGAPQVPTATDVVVVNTESGEYNTSATENIEAGTASLTVTMKDSSKYYQGSATKDFTIAKVNAANVRITKKDSSTTITETYTGSAITPTEDIVKVELNTGVKDASNNDIYTTIDSTYCTFAWSNNITVADSPVLTVSSANIDGTPTSTLATGKWFEIGKKELVAGDLALSKIADQKYKNGVAVAPDPLPTLQMKDDKGVLQTLNTSDYTLSYENDKEIGTAKAIATLNDAANYNGVIKAEMPYHIVADTTVVDKSNSTITFKGSTTLNFTGKAQAPEVTGVQLKDSSSNNLGTALTAADVKLVGDYDFTNASVNPIALKYEVLTGAYKGAVIEQEYHIKQVALTDAMFKDITEKEAYNPAGSTPSVVIADAAAAAGLTADAYTVTYNRNKVVGTAEAVITAKTLSPTQKIANFTGSVTKKFAIEAKAFKAADYMVKLFLQDGQTELTKVDGVYVIAVDAGDPMPKLFSADGKVEYSADNYSAGTPTTGLNPTISVTTKGGIAPGILTTKFKRAEGTIKTATVDGTYTYTGKTQVVALTSNSVKDAGGDVLTQGDDYTLKVVNGVDAYDAAGAVATTTKPTVGAYVELTGIGDYLGSTLYIPFTIAAKDLSTMSITGVVAKAEYNAGNKITKFVMQEIKDGGKDDAGKDLVLVEGKDYTVVYDSGKDIKDVKEYDLVLTGKGNYTKSLTVSNGLEVVGSLVDADNATIDPAAKLTYTGKAVEPKFTIKVGETTLGETDYTIAYTNNVDAGVATAAITITNVNFSGTFQKTFEIGKADAKDIVVAAISPIEFDPAKAVEGEKGHMPTLGSLVVNFNGESVSKDDFDYVVSNNAKVGMATATMTAKATAKNFTGSVSAEYEITALAVSEADVIFTVEKGAYNGKALDTSKVKATLNGEALDMSQFDITATPSDKIGAGKYTLQIAPKADASINVSWAGYEKFWKEELVVEAGNVSADMFKEIADVEYTGSKIEPKLEIVAKELTDADFEVKYLESTNVGEATVMITGKGGNLVVGSTAIMNFNITDVDMSKATVSGIENKTFAGKAITQAPKVVLNGKTLAASNYTVAYKNNDKAGTATMTITGKGNYAGEITKTFKITAPKLSGLKLAKKSPTSLTLSWTKTTGAVSYDVYAAASAKGTYKKVATVKSNTATISKLKSSTNYYYKVRANYKVGSVSSVGVTSSVLTAKTMAPPVQGKKITISTKVTGSTTLAIRKSASTSSTRVGSYKNNQTLSITAVSKDGAWLKTSKGWVSGKHVSAKTAKASKALKVTSTAGGKTTVRSIKAGASVKVYAVKVVSNTYWYLTNQGGWISGAYLK